MTTSIHLSESSKWNLVSLHTAARVVSDVLNPAVVGIPFLLLGAIASDVSGAYRFALLYFAVAVPPPFCYVLWLVVTHRVSDFHLSERHERSGPFVASLVAALLGLILLHALDAPTVLFVALLAAFIQTMILFAITLYWKISIHTAAIAGLTTFALPILGTTALFLTPLVPVVAWARVYLDRHTLLQTVAGGLLGCITFITMYSLRGIAW